MDAIQALIYVNIAIWIGIGAYFFFLARTQSKIDQILNAFISHNQSENKNEN